MNREQEIIKQCEEVKQLLLEKNKAYGDSALSGVKIFSRLDSIQGIMIRIDDKLSRIKNRGITSETEDTVMDLIGYLILLRIAMSEKTNNQNLIDWA